MSRICLISVFCTSSSLRNFCPHAQTNALTIKEWCRSRELSATLINPSVSRVQSQVEKVAQCATLRQSNCRICVCEFYKERKEKPKLRTVEHCHFCLTGQWPFIVVRALTFNWSNSIRYMLVNESPRMSILNIKIVLMMFGVNNAECFIDLDPACFTRFLFSHFNWRIIQICRRFGFFALATFKYGLLYVWPDWIRIRALIVWFFRT